MSSIQSFLRQRNVANSLLQAPINECYYVFVAGPGNYVGNYPPGYMKLAGAEIAAAAAADKLLIRDMGKTIKAPIGVLDVVAVNATEGFFREVQLIKPVAAVGSTGSTTFGVGNGVSGGAAGPNAGNAGYGTFYIPIVIDGSLAFNGVSVAVLPEPYLPFGGQM